MNRTITVGIDGSESSQQAMDWAFAEAWRSGDHVHLLHAASDGAYSGHVDEVMRDALIEDARHIVGEAEGRIPEAMASRCRVEWVLGAPVQVLVHASARSRLTVVGTHRRGAVTSALLGSVGRHVVRYASGSVVVVHPQTSPGTRVVAGLDPELPDPVLPAAFEAAAVRDLPLTVVRAWSLPPLAGPGLAAPMASHSLGELEEGERAVADDLVQSWAAKHPGVEVRLLMVHGDPRAELVEASRGSDLLVTGAHGRGWFSGLLLGSTASTVAAHAHCPVLVAR